MNTIGPNGPEFVTGHAHMKLRAGREVLRETGQKMRGEKQALSVAGLKLQAYQRITDGQSKHPGTRSRNHGVIQVTLPAIPDSTAELIWIKIILPRSVE